MPANKFDFVNFCTNILGASEMTTERTRREFIRDIGIGAAATAFIGNLPSIGFANQERRKHRLVNMFTPEGVLPTTFWPKAEGNLAGVTLKESVTPLEALKSAGVTLHGVCARVRGD